MIVPDNVFKIRIGPDWHDATTDDYFKDKKVLPKANRAVFFRPHELHSSSVCTNQKRRITINFNYF